VPERILVANMNYLGDALMTTPVLALLHNAYGTPPDVIAGGSSGYGALDILRGNPDIGQLISRVDGSAFARCYQLYETIRRGKYDLVVILPSIPAYRWAAKLARTSQIVFVTSSPEGVHMAEHMLTVVAARLGLQPSVLQMTLPISTEAREMGAKLIGDLQGERLIALNLGASRPQKRWPAEAFGESIRRLRRRGYRVALLGSSADRAIASEVLKNFEPDAAIDLTGRTSIAELAAVIERCAVVVSGDTGAMHMAAALNVPLVALFGSTDPAVSGPVGSGRSQILYKHLPCAPCKSHPTCGGKFTCMASISPIEVVSAVEQLAARTAERPTLRIVSS
jgi:heptosyltransferase-2